MPGTLHIDNFHPVALNKPIVLSKHEVRCSDHLQKSMKIIMLSYRDIDKMSSDKG